MVAGSRIWLEIACRRVAGRSQNAGPSSVTGRMPADHGDGTGAAARHTQGSGKYTSTGVKNLPANPDGSSEVRETFRWPNTSATRIAWMVQSGRLETRRRHQQPTASQRRDGLLPVPTPEPQEGTISLRRPVPIDGDFSLDQCVEDLAKLEKIPNTHANIVGDVISNDYVDFRVAMRVVLPPVF